MYRPQGRYFLLERLFSNDGLLRTNLIIAVICRILRHIGNTVFYTERGRLKIQYVLSDGLLN